MASISAALTPVLEGRLSAAAMAARAPSLAQASPQALLLRCIQTVSAAPQGQRRWCSASMSLPRECGTRDRALSSAASGGLCPLNAPRVVPSCPIPTHPPPRSAVLCRALGSAPGAVVAAAGGAGSGLAIDLRGKRAFVAGVADDQGFGWAISKALAEAGAEVLVGTWVPALGIFETSLRRGKFDESRKLSDGSLLEIAKVYPLDAVYDTPEDVPEEVRTNKRYAGASAWTVQEAAEVVKADFGSIDILVHSLANGPEVTKDLLETSRKGYLAALSASSYSYISLLQRFGPFINPGGSAISLTYIASERAIPGYGGGMSSAKAALESDTRVLAWEAGRKWGIRVNTISAGPLRSRAAKAIGFIDNMINYSVANAPLPRELDSDEVGATAAFLASPLASAITGVTLYVDNGLHAMGVAVDSPEISGAK